MSPDGEPRSEPWAVTDLDAAFTDFSLFDDMNVIFIISTPGDSVAVVTSGLCDVRGRKPC